MKRVINANLSPFFMRAVAQITFKVVINITKNNVAQRKYNLSTLSWNNSK